uniref:U28-Hexatoxin-Hc1a_2 n=1 Tax=Hadronyche cerberea TaxID=1107879 RepID=A0A4V2H9J2_HADCE
MNTLIAFGVLLLLSTTLGDTDDKVNHEKILERTELSDISEELLLQQLEAVETALMEKERLEEMEEDGNSREKRCMALNVPCDSHFKCCKIWYARNLHLHGLCIEVLLQEEVINNPMISTE